MQTVSVQVSTLCDWHHLAALIRADGGAPARALNGDPVPDAPLDTCVDLADTVRLLERIGEAAGSSAYAWSLGQRVEFVATDFARAVLGGRSLGSALYALTNFFPLVQDASSLRLDVVGETATLSYRVLDPDLWPRHHDAMFSLGMYARLIRAAAPSAWPQVRLALEVERSVVRADIEGIVQCPVEYGRSANAISFPAHLLDATLELAPPCEASVLRRLNALLARKHRSADIGDRTRVMIFEEMNSGCVSQSHIASALGMSSRTLRRRLLAENLSFQGLLDECRMRYAAHEFRTRSQLSLSDMAFRLGYTEHSTFSRAFSRWAGMAPQDYRRAVTLS